MGLLYDLGSDDVRTELVSALVTSLTGTQPQTSVRYPVSSDASRPTAHLSKDFFSRNRQRVTMVTDDTPLFDDSPGSGPTGGALSTYKGSHFRKMRRLRVKGR